MLCYREGFSCLFGFWILARLKGVFYIALDDGSGRKYNVFEH